MTKVNIRGKHQVRIMGVDMTRVYNKKPGGGHLLSVHRVRRARPIERGRAHALPG